MICLLPHCGYLSETTRMLAIYKALVKCGTRVVVATHGGAHERLLAEAGVQYHIVGPHMSEARAQQLVRIGPGMGPSNQSMWSDEEILQYVLAESEFF